MTPPSKTSPPRFAAGEVLAGRYRIVERVGRGGMGEVYRADDLTLEQPVALKFLPRELVTTQHLKRFRREVSVARQIAHPNVCRVYDIAEAEGLVFLSMEYIDGEDLSVLLRRIGRFPPDKALQISREITSGLAAAHERGVLHRDLKPSNVMLDEGGRVRITDFGLAAAVGTIDKADVRSGTPAYMSPEQWAGDEVTEKSDLYSLGLVLYEIVTGKPPFTAQTLEEIAAQKRGPLPRNPASLVEGLDPAVGRAILSCLEPDPARRPASALAVRAALPGGDPLASAVARGETPAPDLVAEATEGGSLRPAIAWTCLGYVLLAVPLVVWMSGRSRLNQVVPLPKSPAVLAAEARETLASLGYPPPRDTSYGFVRHTDYIDELMVNERSDDWLDLLRRGEPSVVRFWYRESPSYLVPHRITEFPMTELDPPLSSPGMIHAELDPSGRLRELEVVPQQRENEPAKAPADWNALLGAAGFAPERLSPTEPCWHPPVYADERAAFTGSFPDAPEVSVRVEAAALGGRPVWLRVIEPWTEPAEVAGDASTFIRPSDIATTNLGRLAHIGLNLVLIGILGLFARRNLRRGRSDRRNAFVVGLFVFGLQMARWLFGAHHVPVRAEADVVFGGLYRATFSAGLVWLFYIALEPYWRRLWPWTMVSWIRLLKGRLRDPRVGRDVLVGCVLGVSIIAWTRQINLFWPGWLGHVPPRPDLPIQSSEFLALHGTGVALSQLFAMAVNALNTNLFFMGGILLLRFLLRRTWLAISAGLGIVALIYGPGLPYLGFLSAAVGYGIWFFCLLRLGWLPAILQLFTAEILQSYPLTVHLSAWYALPTYLATAVVVGLAVWGFHVSLGGRPAFGDLLAD